MPLRWDARNVFHDFQVHHFDFCKALGRVGKNLLLYVNGTLIDAVESNKIPRGRVIFGGSSNETTDVHVQLDDFLVFSVQ